VRKLLTARQSRRRPEVQQGRPVQRRAEVNDRLLEAWQ
jgi:hypothetical protein